MLSTKLKLGFIDGSFPRPAVRSKKCEQWRRVDLMATSWLWNSISKDLVEAFMYASTSRELWLELQESERSQVLMMDPLPDVEKAYSMIFSVEKQRSVNLGIADSHDQSSKRVLVKGSVHKRLCVETRGGRRVGFLGFGLFGSGTRHVG
ncbi:UNVERIFIED_CONTAM: hypothetical protein Scaly_0588900 [Sesamum calycinum]|uniref:Uncharacterized protein n=1 Tax=Sesamum calycinum TaxID=2727403 RepID=A0AAW2RS50_9LAMI